MSALVTVEAGAHALARAGENDGRTSKGKEETDQRIIKANHDWVHPHFSLHS